MVFFSILNAVHHRDDGRGQSPLARWLPRAWNQTDLLRDLLASDGPLRRLLRRRHLPHTSLRQRSRSRQVSSRRLAWRSLCPEFCGLPGPRPHRRQRLTPFSRGLLVWASRAHGAVFNMAGGCVLGRPLDRCPRSRSRCLEAS